MEESIRTCRERSYRETQNTSLPPPPPPVIISIKNSAKTVFFAYARTSVKALAWSRRIVLQSASSTPRIPYSDHRTNERLTRSHELSFLTHTRKETYTNYCSPPLVVYYITSIGRYHSFTSGYLYGRLFTPRFYLSKRAHALKTVRKTIL